MSNRLVATAVFGGKKARFPLGIVKFFAENAPFQLQNLPRQPKIGHFFLLKNRRRNKSIQKPPRNQAQTTPQQFPGNRFILNFQVEDRMVLDNEENEKVPGIDFEQVRAWLKE